MDKQMLIPATELTPAIRSLALLLFLLPESVVGQTVCDSDLTLEFKTEKKGVVELSEVQGREIIGTNDPQIESPVFSSGTQTGDVIAGKLLINTLDASYFPDEGIPLVEIDRSQNNFWEINIPKDKYNFADRSDLDVEVFVQIEGNKATHAEAGNASSVFLRVDSTKIDDKWYGRSGSLKQLQGSLDFVYTDLQQLGMSGVHRAVLEVCVNINGNI